MKPGCVNARGGRGARCSKPGGCSANSGDTGRTVVTGVTGIGTIGYESTRGRVVACRLLSPTTKRVFCVRAFPLRLPTRRRPRQGGQEALFTRRAARSPAAARASQVEVEVRHRLTARGLRHVTGYRATEEL